MKQAYTSIDQLPASLSAPEEAQVLCISRANAYNLLRGKGFTPIHIGKRGFQTGDDPDK